MKNFKSRLMGEIVSLTNESNLDLMSEIFREFLNTPEKDLKDALTHFILTMSVRLKMEQIIRGMGGNVS